MPANKDKNGTWTVQCYYTDWTGKRKKKKKRGFDTKKAALAWEREFLSKEKTDISAPLSAFTELYFEDTENHLRPTSINTRLGVFNNHILPYFGNRAVSSIAPADIRQWQNRLLKKGLSPSYVQAITGRFSILFNFAVRFYGLPENPCKKAGTVRKPPKNEMKIWTPDEYHAFRETIKDRPELYISFQLLYYTGVRIGELMALTIRDFDQAAGTISITKTMIIIKGSETITPPKTPKGNRVISLPPFLIAELSDFIRRMYYNPRPEYRIIPIARATLKDAIDRNSEKAGVKRIRVHDLRHSHASLLIHQGVSPVAIADRLGHEDASVTLCVYSHLYPSERDEIAANLEQFK